MPEAPQRRKLEPPPRWIIGLFVVLIAQTVLAQSSGAADFRRDPKITEAEVYNPANLKRLAPLALAGNGNAAWTLFSYHAFYRHPPDNRAARKWLEVGVKDHDPESMFGLAQLLPTEDAKNCSRAIALVRQALAECHKPAFAASRAPDFEMRAAKLLAAYRQQCPPRP